MKSQVLDKKQNVLSEQLTNVKAVVHVTYARAKYFEHIDALPKSEVLPSSAIFNTKR